MQSIKRTTVFAHEDVLRKLREIAKRENSTVSEMIRKALREYIAATAEAIAPVAN